MSTNLAYFHQTFLNDITNEVITNINMLGFLYNHLIFDEITAKAYRQWAFAPLTNMAHLLQNLDRNSTPMMTSAPDATMTVLVKRLEWTCAVVSGVSSSLGETTDEEGST